MILFALQINKFPEAFVFSGTRCLLVLATPELRTSCKEVSLPRENLLDQPAAPKVLCQTTDGPKIPRHSPQHAILSELCAISVLSRGGRKKMLLCKQASEPG